MGLPFHWPVLSSFWGGQEGTFLLWALITCTLGLRADAHEAHAALAGDVLPQPSAHHARSGDGDARPVPHLRGRTRAARRTGTEPAAPGSVDDDSSADPLHRLLVAGHSVRDRDGGPRQARLRRLDPVRRAVQCRLLDRHPRHRFHHGRRVGLQGAGLGRLHGAGIRSRTARSFPGSRTSRCFTACSSSA